jgi:8-oxo-dGTP pyrophosphatase MutT (NUDIX family)
VVTFSWESRSVGKREAAEELNVQARPEYAVVPRVQEDYSFPHVGFSISSRTSGQFSSSTAILHVIFLLVVFLLV